MSHIISETDRVLVYEPVGDEGETIGTIIIHGADFKWSTVSEDIAKEFTDQFEFFGEFLESDDFYQGLRKTSVIKRKTDGKLFGYSWFDNISKHGEPYYEPNGDEHGLGWDTWVWLPVEEWILPGYRVIK